MFIVHVRLAACYLCYVPVVAFGWNIFGPGSLEGGSQKATLLVLLLVVGISSQKIPEAF